MWYHSSTFNIVTSSYHFYHNQHVIVHPEQIPTRLVVDVSDISGTEHLTNVYGPGARCSRGAVGSGEYQENFCLLKMGTSCVTNLTKQGSILANIR